MSEPTIRDEVLAVADELREIVNRMTVRATNKELTTAEELLRRALDALADRLLAALAAPPDRPKECPDPLCEDSGKYGCRRCGKPPEQEQRPHRRACECPEPDPVMQADRKFYCYRCSFETGARPETLPEMEAAPVPQGERATERQK